MNALNKIDVLFSLHAFTVLHTSFLSLQNRELQIMRKLDHCNIVRLRYFFYSSGEKVGFSIQPFLFFFMFLYPINIILSYWIIYVWRIIFSFFTKLICILFSLSFSSERWSVSKSGAGFCTRNRVQGGTPFQQVQDHHPHYLCQSKSLCYHDCCYCAHSYVHGQ